MTMFWIVTKDRINVESEDVPMIGKGEVPTQLVPAVSLWTDEFRLLDDDKNVYFEGLCADLANQDQTTAFAPLDDLGAAYGCTSMEYRTKGSSAAWETL